MTEDLAGKINEFKASIQSLWDRIAENDFEIGGRKIFKTKSVNVMQSDYDNDYDHNYADDLPLTVVHDDMPGVKYYATENSPMAVGAEKVEAAGIDKFGDEDDIIDLEAQDEGNQIQNSDLSERFYSTGLDSTNM
jgi:hypothetical protein